MKKIVLLLVFILLQGAVFAQNFNIYKLDSGQTVVIQQVKSNPIVTIDTWVKTGSINENDKNNGVSHFLEHLFFKGTKKLAPGEFDKTLEAKGAITNAATSKDFTHYYVTIPSNYFDLAMDLHSDMLLNPLVPRKELEKERKVVLEEIAKDENNPSQKVFDNLLDMMYTTHPYKRKVLGTGEIIGKITREEILDYYNTHYAPQNMVTIVIGDVDVQHALNKIKEDFKTNECRKLVKNVSKPEKALVQQKVKIDYQPVNSGYLLIGYRGVNALSSDTYALDVLSTILGEGRSSVLYRTIKDEKQLAYSISAGNSTYREDGLFVISANYTPDNLEKLQKAIFEEISKIQKQGVSQIDLDKAKNIIERDTHYSRESISNIASEIGYNMALTDDIKYYTDYIQNIKKVTLSDVKRVACEYLAANKSAVSIVLPVQKNSQNTASVQPQEHVAKLVKDTTITQKYELDNGATLLVTPNDLNDIIAICITAKGGEFLEKIPGTGDLTAAVMLKGTKKYSSLELAQLIEENGIKISPASSADGFSINVLTTKAELDKTLAIIDEVINRANFDDYEIEKTRSAQLNIIKKTRDVPINVALEEYKTLIFENSIYSNSGKILEKTLPKIQRDDILDYYGRIFDAQNLVISVNGNVDSKRLINEFSNVFKNKNGTKFDYAVNSSRIPSMNSPRISVKKIKDLKTAWLIMGWQTSGIDNIKDYATLQVIDSILGSGMSSRLFKNVRDQEGLAYQLGSSYSPNVLKGSFAIYIGTNPKTLKLAQSKLLHEVNRMKTEFVSDKELQEAKDKIIGQYTISLETNLEKAAVTGNYESTGRGFEFKDSYPKLVQSVTASDIIEVANKYFGENFVTSIVEGE